MSISLDVVRAIGSSLIDSLRAQGIAARLFGGAAVAIKVSSLGCQYGQVRSIKDLDIVVREGSVQKATRLLRDSGWAVDRRSLMFSDRRRVNLLHRETRVALDMFSDPLIFNHKIHLGQRIENDFPTITIADLLLTKLQIERPTDSDFRDVVALVNCSRMGSDVFDYKRLSQCCSGDWGLSHACLRNLDATMRYAEAFGMDEVCPVIKDLMVNLRDAPKSWIWWLRSLIGERMRWYYEVD